MKTCSSCKETKPLEEFFNSPKYKDGKQCHCKTCEYRRRKEWRVKNPLKAKAQSERAELKNQINRLKIKAEKLGLIINDCV